MKQGKHTFLGSALFPMLFLLIAWMIFYYDQQYHWGAYRLGVLPRTLSGLTGILFMPLLHGDIHHILSNTFPMLILGTLLFYYYKEIAVKVFFIVYFSSGALTWLTANIIEAPHHINSYHIGASGLIYGLSGFLFFSGIIRKHRALFGVALLVTFLYGTIIWGVFPLAMQKAMRIAVEKENISWEGHLFGFVTGTVLAFLYRKQGMQEPEYSWQQEEEKEEEEEETNPYWMVDEQGNPLKKNDTHNNGTNQEEEQNHDIYKNNSDNPFTVTYTFVPKKNDNEGRDKVG
ncbi:MAG TPA: rhomboid family intramembrane serine protease [Bacteroidia bacterium]